jgi:signal peptidase II
MGNQMFQKINMQKHLVTIGIFGFFLVLDIVTKYFVEAKIGLYDKINVIGSFIQLTKIYNRGGVFGIMQGHQKFFLIVSVAVLILMILFYFFEKKKSQPFLCAMGLIFSGAVGNILDRLMGKPGVVDFIYIGVDQVYKWPAFNVADSSIVIGAILLVIVFYKQEKKL